MKKLLLATSILAGTAGLAAAEITLSGDARMGIINNFVFVAGADDDTVFTSRARVTFTMTGSTDSGLEFGASFRADNAGGAAAGTAGSVYVSGAFGKLSMGDVDGAAAAAMGHVDGVGLTDLGDLNEIVFLGNGGVDMVLFDAPFSPEALSGDPSALYEYSAGAFSVYASVNQLGFVLPTTGYDSTSYAVAASYSMDAYKFALGFERMDLTDGVIDWTIDQVSLGADASFGAITLKARIATGDATGTNGYVQENDQWALSATYSADALAVTAFASNKHMTTGTGANKLEIAAVGLGASYDLGGGASVKGGIVQQEVTTGALAPVKDTAFDLGLSFSF